MTYQEFVIEYSKECVEYGYRLGEEGIYECPQEFDSFLDEKTFEHLIASTAWNRFDIEYDKLIEILDEFEETFAMNFININVYNNLRTLGHILVYEGLNKYYEENNDE